ncbi:phytoene/squalene synthase family protein [Goodfellowiella coeruleoviolacea]|nr:phytoene/squalene synthase family protein [Goodfellowiella coeruleoviolacea]
MSSRELDAAGITDPVVRAAYARCRRINATYGRSFFLATRLLPPAQRPAIHALYGFARWADEIVDSADGHPAGPAGQGTGRTVEQRAAELDRLAEQLAAGLAGQPCRHPVLAALVDTVLRHDIDPALFPEFFAAMRADLRVGEYPDLAALRDYMRGSAVALGLQMLAVFGTVGPRDEAERSVRALGEGLQLTNIIRDVAEDLDRGRVYLPAADMAAFGVDRALLAHCRATGRTEPRVRRLLAHLGALARAAYRQAEQGLPLLAPTARPCVRTALVLYRAILDRVAAVDHEVFAGRVVVSTPRRLAVALPGVGQALWARLTAPATGSPATSPPATNPPAGTASAPGR